LDQGTARWKKESRCYRLRRNARVKYTGLQVMCGSVRLTTRVLYIPQSVDLSLTSNIGIFPSWKLTESFVNDD
jgi:hypothetical protein